MNRPIPSLLLPLWQNESLCETIGMKIYVPVRSSAWKSSDFHHRLPKLKRHGCASWNVTFHLRHVLKPETTKRNDRNETKPPKRPKRNDRNDRNETAEKTKIISTQMKKLNKRPWCLSSYYRSLISHIQYVRDTVTSQILAGLVKMNKHKHDEHENIKKKVDVFSYFKCYSS